LSEATSREHTDADLNVVSEGECDYSRNQSVLGRPVDESAALKDGSDGKYGAGRYFCSADFDCAENVVGGVVHACSRTD
jgi:hypothetical protein